MKNPNSFLRRSLDRAVIRTFTAVAALASLAGARVVRADETCSSPYLARIEGQEEFVYVWTLGVDGLGDGADKLVTLDVKPSSPDYGKVIHSHSFEGRHEAHHGGFTMTGGSSGFPVWRAAKSSSTMFTRIPPSRAT